MSAKNSEKQFKKDGRGAKREALAYCACGCGHSELLDVRHGQKYIAGHGGIALLERRKAALCFAVEVRLIACGAGLLSAARAAKALVDKALKLAQQLVADSWDYLGMRWRTA